MSVVGLLVLYVIFVQIRRNVAVKCNINFKELPVRVAYGYNYLIILFFSDTVTVKLWCPFDVNIKNGWLIIYNVRARVPPF